MTGEHTKPSLNTKPDQLSHCSKWGKYLSCNGTRKHQKCNIFVVSYMLIVAGFKRANYKYEQNHETTALILNK